MPRKLGARVLFFVCPEIEERRYQRSLRLFEQVFWPEVLERMCTSYLFHGASYRCALFTIDDEYVLFIKDLKTNTWSSQTIPPEQAFDSINRSERGEVPLENWKKWHAQKVQQFDEERESYYEKREKKSRFTLL